MENDTESNKKLYSMRAVDLSEHDVSKLWEIVLDAIEGVQGLSFRADARFFWREPSATVRAMFDQFAERQRRTLFRTRNWRGKIDPATLQALRTLGPFVISVSIYSDSELIAGISDAGESISVVLWPDQWHCLRATMKRELAVLPAVDSIDVGR